MTASKHGFARPWPAARVSPWRDGGQPSSLHSLLAFHPTPRPPNAMSAPRRAEVLARLPGPARNRLQLAHEPRWKYAFLVPSADRVEPVADRDPVDHDLATHRLPAVLGDELPQRVDLDL